MNKFDIQTHLNDLARRYSESLVDKAYTYINAVLEEAVGQDFLEKNSARKVEMPRTRKLAKRRELFVLRWKDLEPGRILGLRKFVPEREAFSDIIASR